MNRTLAEERALKSFDFTRSDVSDAFSVLLDHLASSSAESSNQSVSRPSSGSQARTRQLFLVYLSQQPGEMISAESLVSSIQFFPLRDRTMEATFSSPSAANAFATATSPNRLCLFSAATIARRRSAFVEE